MKTSMYSPNQQDWIVKMYLEGHSIIELARFTGLNRMSVSRLIKRYNARRRLPTPLDKDEFLSLQ